MAISKNSKIERLEEIRQCLKESASFVLLNYAGINVATDTGLRKLFREKGVQYKVYKNRLLKIALNELGYTEYDKFLEGPTAVAFSKDPTSAAATVIEGSRSIPHLKVKCGSLDGAFIDEEGVRQLAAMPSREVLLSMLLGVLQAPIKGLAVGLNATIAGLARAVQAVADKKQTN